MPPRVSRVVRTSPVYYGWVVLVAAMVGLLMTMPGQTVSVSVFLDPILAELELSRTRVSLMYTLATLAGSLALPFVGRFIDRRGPRTAVILIASLFALACVFMGLVQGLLTLVIGFLLIRSLGQGALSLVSQHVINLWFVRRRGLAVGLAGIGFALGVAFFPTLIDALIQSYGWRTAYMLLGGLVALSILPLGALFYRYQPEDYGLEPDGRARAGRAALAEDNFSLPQARLTLTFWLFVAGSVCVAALGTALIFHNYDLLAEQGLSRELATRVFVPLGFVQLLANLLTGYVFDRLPPRYVLMAGQLLLVAALLLATLLGSPALVLAYGIVLGLVQGVNATLTASVFAHYFGRRHLGTIKGFVTTLTVAGTAVGPVIFSLGKDAFGTYDPVLWLTALLPLTIALAAPFVRPPVTARPD